MNRETLEPGRRWIGRVLRDRWRIDARISRGGVGTVYAATHKNNGSRAAIKVLHPEFSRDADTRSRFLQEGYAANQVNHPGVVRILDDDVSEEGHAYLVMELLEGELLEARRLRKGGKLSLPDVFEVGEQLLDVLAAAHDKQIVHRDIKPDNLFITQEGRLKVLDFGFAQIRSSFRSEQTATGFLLGTPGFMSPEQAVGNRPEIDAQTDIWAVGATLFTLISGEPVHAGESAAEMLVAAANFAPRSLSSVTRGLDPRLVNLVDRAVAFAKADRWPSARAMQFALRAVSGKQGGGQVSRRSVPDDGPTLFDGGEIDVEELDASELEDAKASWSSAVTGQQDRTVIAAANVTAEALGSVTAPAAQPVRPRHASDDDGPTIAVSGGAVDVIVELAASSSPTPHSAPYPLGGSGMFDPQADGGTLIMESPMMMHEAVSEPRVRPQGGGSASSLATFGAPIPFGQPPAVNGTYRPPSDPGLFQHRDARGVGHLSGVEASFASTGANPALRAQPLPPPPGKGGARVLLLLGITLGTMIVVIAVGLLVLAASD